jgi:hypothetical protein
LDPRLRAEAAFSATKTLEQQVAASTRKLRENRARLRTIFETGFVFQSLLRGGGCTVLAWGGAATTRMPGVTLCPRDPTEMVDGCPGVRNRTHSSSSGGGGQPPGRRVGQAVVMPALAPGMLH